ncbi:MAG: hypothetical protein IKD25_09800 [Bacteroidaceae bacterium]|nr:hypothetical protein [Bacteroidaceae bacterium]
MIPKIIHYSWISTDPKPELVERCMKTWKEMLPDYEVVLWDAQKIQEEIQSVFVDEAISVRKWAFAADFVRLHAVYRYGGIWLDSDVEVKKPFDDLLHQRMFIGQEAATFFSFNTAFKETHLTSHCFGAEPGHPFLKKCLDYYQGRHFITSTNGDLPQHMRYDMTLLPLIQSQLLQAFGYKEQAYFYNQKQCISEGICVYPSYYFDAPKSRSMKNVYCIHQCMESWGRGGVPRPRTYGTWKQILYWGMMDFVNLIPRLFGKEICLCFCKW